ncbi:MAG: MFS transporter [Geminicoccaceae bacterium]|jgi:MFS family permease|nr:MFS transporter [Geminicoccaceae bacterium]
MVRLASFTALFVSAGLLLGGNGLFGTLIAVRANLEAFSPTMIGLLGSVFYAGFVAGSLYAPRLIIRAGHIRTFAAAGAMYAVAALLHAMLAEPWLWLLLRTLGGFCFAGLTLVLESWLNERTPNSDRGRVLSLYRLVDLACVTLGQLVLTLADPRGFELFSLVAILFCCCLVPLAMTRSTLPAPLQTPRLRLGRLIAVSPLGTIGVFSVGLVNSTFRTVAPVALLDQGLTIAEIAWLMSAFIAGGAVMQFPIGALSDRLSRRTVLLATTTGAIATSFAMSVATGLSPTAIILTGFLFGGFAIPIYSLSVAHANDLAQPDEFVEVAAGLFFVYGIGAMVGPLLGAGAVALLGPQALFWYTSGVHGFFLLFTVYRISRRPRLPTTGREGFVGLIRTSPGIFKLDPRGRERK